MEIRTVHQIQSLVRGRREDLGLTQLHVATSAGVSRKWLSDFERGATFAVELPHVMRTLAALGLALSISESAPVDSEAADADATDLDTVLARHQRRIDLPRE